MKAIERKRILVTGASGFIGRRVVALATAAGAEVSALCRPGKHRCALHSGDLRHHLEVDIADLDAPAQVIAAFDKARPQLVVHAAGIADWSGAASVSALVRTHVAGTFAILEASRKFSVEHVVLIGSAGEYGAATTPCAETSPSEPKDPYSVSKLAATTLGLCYRALELRVTVVRPFLVYGPGEPERRLLPTVFHRALSGGGPIPFTAGEQVRDFVYVDEVAEGILRAAAHSSAIGVVNLGTGVETTVKQAILTAAQTSDNMVTPNFGALPYRSGEPMYMVADTKHVATTLGWKPGLSLAEGLLRTWTSLQATRRSA